MAHPRRIRFLLTAGLLATLASGACDNVQEPLAPDADLLVTSEAHEADIDSEALEIVSWNTYLGGDTGPLFSLDFSDIPAVIAASQTFWAQVKENYTNERMAEIVDEIEARSPHFVALQEAIQFAVVDMTTGQIVDGVDILASIQGQLAARGVAYELVAVQNNTSSALPLAIDFSTMQPSQVLAFTERIVMLRRADVVLTDQAQGQYGAAIPLGPLTVTRGWIRASFEHKGRPMNLVTTHLETQGAAPVHNAQADELLNSVVAGLTGPVILTGDLNSDASAHPGAPSWTPTYGLLTTAGFKDLWTQRPQKTRGFTCCQNPDLRNGASLLDERIDFVLVRDPDDPHLNIPFRGMVEMEILGEEQGDKTPAHGLWPADHAGLSVSLRMAPGPT